MSHAALAVVAATNLLTALSFAAVGARLAGRMVTPPTRLALLAMATWWGSMAILVGLQGILTLAYLLGSDSLTPFTLARFANALLLSVGPWGLCFHVAFLRTGDNRWAGRLAPYFAVIGALNVVSVVTHPIVALEMAPYEVVAVNDPPLDGDPLWSIVAAGVGLPLIVASLAYLALIPRLTRRDQKRRALLASGGVLLWVVAGLVAQVAGGPLADFVTYTVLGLLAAALAWLAYFPPHWLRRFDRPGDYLEVTAPRKAKP